MASGNGFQFSAKKDDYRYVTAKHCEMRKLLILPQVVQQQHEYTIPARLPDMLEKRLRARRCFTRSTNTLRCPHVLFLGVLELSRVLHTQEVTLFGLQKTNTEARDTKARARGTSTRHVVFTSISPSKRYHARHSDIAAYYCCINSSWCRQERWLRQSEYGVGTTAVGCTYSIPPRRQKATSVRYVCVSSYCSLGPRHSRHRWPSRPTGSAS